MEQEIKSGYRRRTIVSIILIVLIATSVVLSRENIFLGPLTLEGVRISLIAIVITVTYILVLVFRLQVFLQRLEERVKELEEVKN